MSLCHFCSEYVDIDDVVITSYVKIFTYPKEEVCDRCKCFLHLRYKIGRSSNIKTCKKCSVEQIKICNDSALDQVKQLEEKGYEHVNPIYKDLCKQCISTLDDKKYTCVKCKNMQKYGDRWRNNYIYEKEYFSVGYGNTENFKCKSCNKQSINYNNISKKKEMICTLCDSNYYKSEIKLKNDYNERENIINENRHFIDDLSIDLYELCNSCITNMNDRINENYLLKVIYLRIKELKEMYTDMEERITYMPESDEYHNARKHFNEIGKKINKPLDSN